MRGRRCPYDRSRCSLLYLFRLFTELRELSLSKLTSAKIPLTGRRTAVLRRSAASPRTFDHADIDSPHPATAGSASPAAAVVSIDYRARRPIRASTAVRPRAASGIGRREGELNDELRHVRATAGGALDLLKGYSGNIGAAEAV